MFLVEREPMAIIFQTHSVPDAHMKVHVTKNPGVADLFVYPVSSMGMAKGDALWFITESRARATTRIFLSPLAEAALIVYYVKSQAESGWRNNKQLGKSL
ncbi:MAG: hypothetical protein CMQ40_03890 [Gammaproteobacteria bacterium]|nr:hypothetical protein [Gammaproteobacteria bacterium]|tara:strand:- start:156 stop:455 length:300 start_codon:yes stop_codon:yes gene_type:complete